MTSENMNSFIMALEAVKKDYTCPVCKELLNQPVTLMCCFSFICEEHIEELFQCPACDKTLLGVSVFKDEKLKSSVNSTFELYKIFSQFKTDTNPNVSNDDKNITIRGRRYAKRPASKTIDKVNMEELRKKSPEIETSEVSAQSTISSKKQKKESEKRNKKGETALHAFCRHGKLDKVQELLKEGANSNTKDHAGWTPLHEAVQSNRLDMVKLLLSYKTLVNVPGLDNETPLHEAVRYNFKEIVNELVIHGADLNAKNSKGETPIQIANNEIKQVLDVAVENIVQTQTDNVTNLSSKQIQLDYEDIRVYCVTKFRTVQNKLKTLAKNHRNITIEVKFTKKVTHLIVDTDDGVCLSSLDVLQGIIYGVWILSMDWIIKSTDSELAEFSEYEIEGIGTRKRNGAKISRYNRYKQLPSLFNGCHFYFHNFNINYELTKTLILSKSILSKLIIDGGGVVLRRTPNPESIPDNEKLVPYHAKKGGKLEKCSHYIIYKDIYEPKYNMNHLKALPIAWLLECIETYELCEP